MISIALSGTALLACLGFAWLAPAGWQRLVDLVVPWLAALVRRRALAVLVVGVLSLLLNAAITTLVGVSPPHIHDEFANLLAADTFLHGRLVNPPHPMWEFLESIHVLSQPVYMSKYPPAQGLMLAVGQGLAGQPVVGMWLSVALACAAICWALQAWVSPRWALLGGLLAVFHPVLLKWGQVYWGGTEALLGGALVVGAWRRLLRHITWPRASALVIGLVLLALSRPFEGLLLAVLALGGLLVGIWRQREDLSLSQLRALVLPVMVGMGLFLGWQALYNDRATGSFLKLPYLVYEEQHAVAPFLVWQKPRPEPRYRHPFIRDHFVGYALEEYQRQQSWPGLLRETWSKITRLAKGYLWNYWLLVPAVLGWVWQFRRGGWSRYAAGITLVFLAVLLQETWMWDRYAAPGGVLFLLLVVMGFHRLARWQGQGRVLGSTLVVGLSAACLVQSALWVKNRKWEYSRRDWDWQRVALTKQLESQGGTHLVIVHQGARQSVHNDWVHNGAAIDQQRVVWARDLGPAQTPRLLAYYADRKVWLLEVENPWEPEIKDIQKAVLKPYPAVSANR
jgi:hypothetical protein